MLQCVTLCINIKLSKKGDNEMKDKKRLQQIEIALQIAKIFEEMEHLGIEDQNKLKEIKKLQEKLVFLEESVGAFSRGPKIDFDVDWYMKLLNKGMFLKDIAKEMGISRDSVTRYIKKYDLPKRKGEKSYGKQRRKGKIFYNGKEYNSEKDMCSDNGVKYEVYKSRKKLGHSFENCMRKGKLERGTAK